MNDVCARRRHFYLHYLLGSVAIAALMSTPVQAQTAPSPAAPTPAPESIEEIVVVSKSGSQAVRSISGSVTAITGAQLEALGAQSFEDYLTRTPGVVFNAGIPGLSSATIRGVSTTTSVNNGQGTTGYFINDVPMTDPFNSAGIPDIDAFDVSDVTVLRGPQGTLFGSASLGGAINYQATLPNLSQYEAHVQTTLEGTDHGGIGGAGKLMLNVPVIDDQLAVRAVYAYRSDAGYIDNIGTGDKDANTTTTNGGRLEIAWKPSSTTRVNYLFLDQTEDTDDVGDQEPQAAGRLAKNTLIAEPVDFRTTIHNLRVDQDLGFATLTATATYHEKTSAMVIDYTAPTAPLLPGISPVQEKEVLNSEGTTFEVRLASPQGQPFEYLIGAYHDDTREHNDDTFTAANAAAVIDSVYGPFFGQGIGEALAPGGVFFEGVGPFRGRETAVFGEATYHFDDHWKLTLGGRAFYAQTGNATTEQDFYELATAGVPSLTTVGQQSDKNVAPKASLTWTPSERFMTYALVDKGFRFGGPNLSPSTTSFAIPPSFATDSLWNYELGERSSWLDNRLQVDASVFYIDWSKIQLEFDSPTGFSYVTNAGKANNYGVEGSATWKLLQHVTLKTDMTYLNATLASDYNPGSGAAIVPKGSTLPGASKWQVANSLSYWMDAPVEAEYSLSQRYISNAPGAYSGGAPQGGYNIVDARATFHFDRFDVSPFIDNLFNSHGVTSASHTAGLPLEQFLVRPLTAGITLDYRL